jgi:predicted RNA-binding protein with PIN domain
VAEPTLYLFDGFNLLHAGGFQSPEALRDLLAGWVAIHGARGILVFDGHGPDAEHGPLSVRWAPDADAAIERLAAEFRGLEQVAVVSSDEAVRGTSGSQVRKMSSLTFLGELVPPEHSDRARGDLRDKLDLATLARLEQLRRGQD